jgi:hypothetical protein
MSKFGAFVAGFGTGFSNGRVRAMQQERLGMERDRFKREKERYEREQAAWKGLADLAEKYGGFAPPPPPPPSATSPASGPWPSAMPEDSSWNTPVEDAADGDSGMARGGIVARRGVLRRGYAEGGIVSEPDTASPGSEVPPSPSGDASIGPRTNEDRLGYALYRKPDLFANPEFLNKAAKLFLDAGMPQGVRWLEAGSRVQRENWPKAMKLLSAGDAAGAEEAFNSTGRLKVVPGSTKEIGEGKWQSTLEGGETKVFEPLKYMRAMLSPKEFFTLDMQQKKIQSDAEDRKAAREDRGYAQANTLAERERHNRSMEGMQSEMLQFRKERGVDSETAMIKNINYLVKSGVAKDHREAFDRLRTAMEKPEDDAILSVAKTLMQSPKYFGQNGTNRAMQDAQSMVGALKKGKASGAGGSFKSADDVRTAFRAGRINRATAIKELGGFGFQTGDNEE